jgi:PhzF family phenazine biosynthesis protein
MKIRIVDAFTDRAFAGNPAGVVVLGAKGFLLDRQMQQIAAEVNLSETAFVHPLPPGGEADWALRWLTPTAEVNLCGHATLATAHVLYTCGLVTGTMRFASRGGVLLADVAADGRITLDFPVAPLTPEPHTAAVAAALGAEVLSAFGTGPNVGDLLVEVADEKTVRSLAPDLGVIAQWANRGVIATAAAEDPAGEYDFVSRCFFPGYGIDEDPVTGSAHTALAPFWSARLGRDELTGFQASARTGLVGTALRGDRVLLTGGAVTVIDGELLVQPLLV